MVDEAEPMQHQASMFTDAAHATKSRRVGWQQNRQACARSACSGSFSLISIRLTNYSIGGEELEYARAQRRRQRNERSSRWPEIMAWPSSLSNEQVLDTVASYTSVSTRPQLSPFPLSCTLCSMRMQTMTPTLKCRPSFALPASASARWALLPLAPAFIPSLRCNLGLFLPLAPACLAACPCRRMLRRRLAIMTAEGRREQSQRCDAAATEPCLQLPGGMLRRPPRHMCSPRWSRSHRVLTQNCGRPLRPRWRTRASGSNGSCHGT